MVTIQIKYDGGLRCTSTHSPSRTQLISDAPVDNMGKGESFSPTDLVATALGTCMLTTMGIVASKNGWKIDGSDATVVKHMVADPLRRIGKLEVTIRMRGDFDARARETLEHTAHNCPVNKSIAASIEVPLKFEWSANKARA
jgi:putative redox protein